MKETTIEEVKIDDENRLMIRPKIRPNQNYEYIYRDASGITWIEQLQCLGAREPEKWNHIDLFKQVITAVQREYGELLVVTSDTKWTNISTSLENELRSEINKPAETTQFRSSEGKMFGGAAALIGLASIGWAVVCFCGGPDAAAGSAAAIRAGLLFSGVGLGLLYYSFR